MKRDREKDDWRFELVLTKFNEKTSKEVFDKSRRFSNGHDMWQWAINVRPQWKYEE